MRISPYFFCLLFSSLSSLSGADLLWTGINGPQWTDSGNWAPHAPGAGDTAIFIARDAMQTQALLDQDAAVRGLVFNGFVKEGFQLEGSGLLLIDSASAKLANALLCNGRGGVSLSLPIRIHNSGGGASRIAANRSLTLTGSCDFQTPVVLQGNPNSKLTVSGPISGDAESIAVQNGLVEWTGDAVNRFSGDLVVRLRGHLVLNKEEGLAYQGRSLMVTHDGVVEWQANDQVGDRTNVAMGGGVVRIGDMTDRVGALILNQDAVVDFSGESGGILEFADSSLVPKEWGGNTLTVQNFDPLTDRLRFGTSDDGIQAEQLALIRFTDQNTGARIDSEGWILPAE